MKSNLVFRSNSSKVEKVASQQLLNTLQHSKTSTGNKKTSNKSLLQRAHSDSRSHQDFNSFLEIPSNLEVIYYTTKQRNLKQIDLKKTVGYLVY